MDRSTVLGNPYVVRYERERHNGCVAYRALLRETMLGPRDGEGGGKVARVGGLAGFGGEVRPWDWDGARRAMGRLIEAHRSGANLWLLCHCAPRECHGNSIADWRRGLS